MAKKINPVDPNEIPEVATYMEIRASLEGFKESNREVFEAFDTLVQAHNTALEAADKVVRAREISCGPWEYYQQQQKIDVDGLYDALGREKFLSIGGQLKTITTRDVDKTKLNSAITRGDIPEKVVDTVITLAPRYHAPKPIKT
ncbi:MAG: hypothetical protein AMS18_16455 [Gemmatimonas sp. SG8_17]|nr:MAG: hypothetical protein AMS18_16455 [Gemmatimonas sp. SG8_17]